VGAGVESEGDPMPKTRKTHPPALKAKGAVEAIRAQRTTSEISQMFDAIPMSRRDLLDGNPERCEIPGPARNT